MIWFWVDFQSRVPSTLWWQIRTVQERSQGCQEPLGLLVLSQSIFSSHILWMVWEIMLLAEITGRWMSTEHRSSKFWPVGPTRIKQTEENIESLYSSSYSNSSIRILRQEWSHEVKANIGYRITSRLRSWLKQTTVKKKTKQKEKQGWDDSVG